MSVARVAAAQIDFTPAYSSRRIIMGLGEPIFPHRDAPGLFSIMGAAPVSELREGNRREYIAWHTSRLMEITAWAQNRHVHILVFPEYSVPAESIPDLVALAKKGETTIVAGSHTVTNRREVREAYETCGIDIDASAVSDDADVFKAVCPVIGPTGICGTIFKMQRSGDEDSLVTDPASWKPVAVPLCEGAKINVGVLLCIDALAAHAGELGTIGDGLAQCDLIVVPACSHSVDPFKAVETLALLHERPVVFCNSAEFGRSAVFAHAGGALPVNWPGLGQDQELPSRAEAVIGCDLQLPSITKRGSGKPTFPCSAAFAVPIGYLTESPDIEQLQETVSSVAESLEQHAPEDGREQLELVLAVCGDQLPPLPERRLRSLIQDVLPESIRIDLIKEYTECLVMPSTVASPGQLRLHLLNSNRAALQSMLDESGDQSFFDAVEAVMSEFRRRVADLRAIVREPPAAFWEGLPETTSAQVGQRATEVGYADFHGSWADRGDFIDWLDVTVRGGSRVAVISGLPGIGKRWAVRGALSRRLPSWRYLSLPTHEDWGVPRLMSEVAALFGLSCDADAIDRFDDKAVVSYWRKILKNFDAYPNLVLIIEDFDNVVARECDTRVRLIGAFLVGIQGRASFRGNPVVLTAYPKVPLPEPLRSQVAVFRLSSFTKDDYSDKVLRYWCDALGPAPPTGEAKKAVLRLAHGHPLAIRILATLLARGVQLSELETALQHEVERTLLPKLLSRLTLDDDERRTAAFAAVFRGPVAVQALVSWRGELAVNAAASLKRHALIEEPRPGLYVLHPLLRHFFLGQAETTEIREYHKAAARYFEQRVGERSPEKRHHLAAELVHHLGEAGIFGRQNALRRQYVEELKPIARRTYSRGSRNPDAYGIALEQYKALDDLSGPEGDVDVKAGLGRCYFRVAKIAAGQPPGDASDWSWAEEVTDTAADSGDDIATRGQRALEYQQLGGEKFEEAIALAGRRNAASAYYVHREYGHALVAAYRWPQERTAFEQARKLFDTAADLYPEYRRQRPNLPEEDPDLVSGIAFMHMKQGDDDRALEEFRRAVDMLMYWDRPYAPYWLCRMLLKRGHWDEARELYTRLRNLFPQDDRIEDLPDRFKHFGVDLPDDGKEGPASPIG